MDDREIPQRELRNDISRILREVEQGASFRVTVGGRPVAEVVPASNSRTWVPWSDVERIRQGAPLDPALLSDVDELLGQTIDEL